MCTDCLVENPKWKALSYEQTELLDSPILDGGKVHLQKHKHNAPAKKPRLEWVLEETFAVNHEALALSAWLASAPTGYSMSKNQPYTNRYGELIQCYRCSGEKRNNCGFKAKLVYDWNNNSIQHFTSGAHMHQKQNRNTIGVQPKLKPVIIEAVKDGMMPELDG